MPYDPNFLETWKKDPGWEKVPRKDQETAVGRYFEQNIPNEKFYDFHDQTSDQKEVIRKSFIDTHLGPVPKKKGLLDVGDALTTPRKLTPTTPETYPKDTELPPSRLGVVGDIGSALAATTLDVVQQGARTLRALDKPDSRSDFMRNMMTPFIEGTKNLEEENPVFFKPSKETGESFIRNAIYGGVRASGPSLAFGIPSAVIGSLIAPGVGTILGWAIGPGTVFAASEFDRYMEEAMSKGKTWDESFPYALSSGLIEGGGEALSNVIGAKIFKIGGEQLLPFKKTLKEMLARGPALKFLKGLGKTVATEIPTEMGQEGGEQFVRNVQGLSDESPLKAAVGVVGPTLVMSLLFASGGSYYNGTQKSKIKKSLINADADTTDRESAADAIHGSLLKEDPEMAKQWEIVAKDYINNKKSIPIDDDISNFVGKAIKDDIPGKNRALFNQEKYYLDKMNSGETLNEKEIKEYLETAAKVKNLYAASMQDNIKKYSDKSGITEGENPDLPKVNVDQILNAFDDKKKKIEGILNDPAISDEEKKQRSDEISFIEAFESGKVGLNEVESIFGVSISDKADFLGENAEINLDSNVGREETLNKAKSEIYLDTVGGPLDESLPTAGAPVEAPLSGDQPVTIQEAEPAVPGEEIKPPEVTMEQLRADVEGRSDELLQIQSERDLTEDEQFEADLITNIDKSSKEDLENDFGVKIVDDKVGLAEGLTKISGDKFESVGSDPKYKTGDTFFDENGKELRVAAVTSMKVNGKNTHRYRTRAESLVDGQTEDRKQVFTGRIKSSGKFGSSVGKLSEGDQRQLMVDPNGGYFWGEYKESSDLRNSGDLASVVKEGEHKDFAPAEFKSGKEAKAAGESTAQNITQPKTIEGPAIAQEPEIQEPVETVEEIEEKRAPTDNRAKVTKIAQNIAEDYKVPDSEISSEDFLETMTNDVGMPIKRELAFRYGIDLDEAEDQNDALLLARSRMQRNMVPQKRVEEMTETEKDKELTTNFLTGLRNKRAFKEDPRGSNVVNMDGDSLKFYNDNFGHHIGDKLLQTIGNALSSEVTGLPEGSAYHLSGDEFALQGNDPDALNTAINNAKVYLADKKNYLKVKSKSGVEESAPVGVTYAEGPTLRETEGKLQEQKDRREVQGKRAGRGDTPPGLLGKESPGRSDSGDKVRGKGGLDKDEAGPVRDKKTGKLEKQDALPTQSKDRIGEKWESDQGTREIKDTYISDGEKAYLVSDPKTDTFEIIPVKDIQRVIENEIRVAKSNKEYRAKIEKQEAQDAEIRKEKELSDNSIYGYEEGKSNFQLSRIKKQLNKQIRVEGKVVSNKARIKELIDGGNELTDTGILREVGKTEGRLLNKTEQAFAKYLINKVKKAAKPEPKIRDKKTGKLKALPKPKKTVKVKKVPSEKELARRKKLSERMKKERVTIGEKDEILTAVAKFGGIDLLKIKKLWAETISDIFKNKKINEQIRGLPVIRKDGKGLNIEDMAALLAEEGYLEKDQNGKFEINDLFDKFQEAGAGHQIFRITYDFSREMDQLEQEYYENLEELKDEEIDPEAIFEATEEGKRAAVKKIYDNSIKDGFTEKEATQIANETAKWFDDQIVSPETPPVEIKKIKAFHGSGIKFDKFNDTLRGSITGAKSAAGAIWFTDSEDVAKAYSIYAAETGPVTEAIAESDRIEKEAKKEQAKSNTAKSKKLFKEADDLVQKSEELAEYNATFERRKGANVKKVVLEGDFLEVDAQGKTPQELSADDNIDSWLDLQLKTAKAEGKDGVIIKNLDDAVGLYDNPATHYAVFDSKNISYESVSNKEKETTPGLVKIKEFKTDEGKFSSYDITNEAPRNRANIGTVHEAKEGWVVRNIWVPKELQRKGIAAKFYKQMNEESIKSTGNPLRSTQERNLANGEVVHEVSADAIALWDSFVKEGIAEKLGEKNYLFNPPFNLKQSKSKKKGRKVKKGPTAEQPKMFKAQTEADAAYELEQEKKGESEDFSFEEKKIQPGKQTEITSKPKKTTLIKNPAGTYSFVGSVDGGLIWENTKTGEAPTDAQMTELKSSSNPSMWAKTRGFKAKRFTTQDEAVSFAESLGIEVVIPWERPKLSAAKKLKTKSSTVKNIQEKIDPILLKVPNLKVEVVQSSSDLPFETPTNLDAGKIEGAYYQGKVYLVADNLSPSEAPKILLDEAYGHFGLELLGQEGQSFLNELWTQQKTAIKEYASTRDDLNTKTKEGQIDAANEFFSHKLRTDPAFQKSGIFNRFVQILKRWMRKVGLNFQITKSEIADMINKAQETVDNVSGVGAGIDRPAFSLRDTVSTFYSQLLKVVQGSQDNIPTKAQSVVPFLQKKGVKPAEIKWMDVESWIKNNTKDGKIDKKAFLQYLEDNQIQMRESTLGAGTIGYESSIEIDDAETELDHRIERLRVISEEGIAALVNRGMPLEKASNLVEIMGQIEQDTEDIVSNAFLEAEQFAPNYDWDKLDRAGQLMNNAYEDLAFTRAGIQSEETFHDGYVEAGGKNYREMLFKLPERGRIIYTEDNVVAVSGDELVSGNEKLFWHFKVPGNILQIPKSAHKTAAEAKDYVIREKSPEAPLKENFKAEAHWPDLNVVAHARFNERTDSDGNKVLFIEEIQSDWHQKGKREGYRTSISREKLDDLSAQMTEIEKLYPRPDSMSRHYYVSDYLPTKSDEYITLMAQREREMRSVYPRGVPDAPFKDTWHEMVFKRMLRFAAENGFDKVAWTTGEQQAARYDLSKVVDTVRFSDNSKNAFDNGIKENTWSVVASQDGENKWMKQAATAKEIEDTLGKEIAKKITEERDGELTGLDLKVGGKGMVSFYDGKVTGFAKKYGKQWGAKVEPVDISFGNDSQGKGTGEYAVVRNRQNEDNIEIARFKTKKEAIAYGKTLRDKGDNDWAVSEIKNTPVVPVPAITVTPEMKDSVLYKGQPLFSTKQNQPIKLNIAAAKARLARIEESGTKGEKSRVKEEQNYIKNKMPKDVIKNVKTLFSKLEIKKEDKEDTTILNRYLSSPEFYFEKVPAAQRVLDASLNRADYYHENLNEITENENGSMVGKESNLQLLKKNFPGEYKKLKDLLVKADREKITYVAADLTELGFSEIAVNAWIDFRAMMNTGFDLLFADMKKIVDQYESIGAEIPDMNVTIDGKNVKIKLKESLKEMGDLRGHYFPRNRASGRFKFIAKKKGENNVMEFSNSETVLSFKKTHYEDLGYEVEVSDSKQMPEDVFEMYGKAIGTQAMVNSALEHMDKQKKKLSDFGLSGKMQDMVDKNGDKLGTKEFVITEGSTSKEMGSIFKKLGGRRYAHPKGTKEMWRFHDPAANIQHNIVKALGGMSDQELFDTQVMFAKGLVIQLADIVKGRGFRGSMIRRAKGNAEDVWVGYEEDPLFAAVEYSKRLSSGLAKKQTAMEMTQAITGTDISRTDYAEGPEGFKEYIDEIENRRIDPLTQKNIFHDVKIYMEEQLRNQELMDVVIGTAKGLAVLQYLGGRLPSLAVNLTALATSVPATMNGLGSIPFSSVPRLLKNALRDYGIYQFRNRSSLPKAQVELFDFIHKEGWAESQHNKEALSVLMSTSGKAWSNLIEWSMFGFGVTERINRVVTHVAAYNGIMEKEGKNYDKEDALRLAHKISNRAHGVYGKPSLPYVAQGKNLFSQVARSFLVFHKFSHTYLLNMYDLGVNQKKAKAVLFMAFAPVFLAGAGSFPFWGAIMKVFEQLGADDPEEAFYNTAAEYFGEFGSNLFRDGLIGLGGYGVSLEGSLAIDPSETPKSILDLFGAPGSIVKDIIQGIESMTRGDAVKGAEKIAPRAIASPIKAVRESKEGITTRNNTPVFWGPRQLVPNKLESFYQFLGFNPASLNKKKRKIWSDKKIFAKYQGKKSDINSRWKKAVTNKDAEAIGKVRDEITKFNEDIVNNNLTRIVPRITYRSLRSAVRSTTRAPKRERLRQVDYEDDRDDD